MSRTNWVDDGVVDDSDPTTDTPADRMSARSTQVLPTVSEDGDVDTNTDVDTDASGTPSTDDSPPKRGGARRGAAFWATGALVVILLLLAAAITTGVFWARAAAGESGREEALAAARQSAVNLTTVDFNRAEADVQRVLEGATGDFGGLFGQNMDSYVSVVKQGKVVTKGEVAEAGLQKYDGDTATAAVAVKASVKNGGNPNGEERFYRLVEDMQKHDGRWLVARVEFVP